MLSMSDAASKAKDTLLRALDEFEEAQRTLERSPDRVDLIVVYSIGRDLGEGGWHEVGGWASTPGPDWAKAALLKRAARAFKDEAAAIHDEPDEPDEPKTFGSP